MEVQQHISQQYNKDLKSIKSNVLSMGCLVELQVQNAIYALLNQDQELAKEVSVSDYKINKMEMEIDADCAKVIAKRQPAAGDLRLVIAVVKIITDLERIGDEAEKIGRYAKKMALKEVAAEMHAELSSLGSKVMTILHDTLDSFARMDAQQAIKVVASDAQIDDEFNKISRLLLTHMMESPRNIKHMLRVTWCVRALERIGDHSQNICEHVVYSVNGKDVRHVHLNKPHQGD